MKCGYCKKEIGDSVDGWLNCPRCHRAQFVGQKAPEAPEGGEGAEKAPEPEAPEASVEPEGKKNELGGEV